jgi:hypothetical protein
MSSENWGDLQKSQVDPHTIDEEIDDKIQAHDDDPDAHLDVSQSLQSHKASEIIDHLAASIIEDKIGTGEISSRCITTDQVIGKDFRTAADVGAGVDGVKFDETGIEMWQDGKKKVDIPVSGDPSFVGTVRVGSLEFNRFTLQTSFESLDGMNKSAGVNQRFGYVDIPTSGVLNDWQRLSCDGDDFGGLYVDVAKSPTFEGCLLVDTGGGIDVRIGFQWDATEGVCGFKIDQDHIYANWFEDDMTEHTWEIEATVEEVYRIYRVEVDSGVEVRWYIDGVLKMTKTWAQIGSLATGYYPFVFYIKSPSATSSRLIVNRVLFQQTL